MRRVMTVLVVEDDPSLRFMLRVLVQDEFGARVVEARDGAEALDLAYRERPDVVLLDMMLPVLDGAEVARRLKADPTVNGVPILAVSAVVGRDTALAAGCDGFVAKPFDLDDLLGALMPHLRPMAGGALWPELARARLAGEAIASFAATLAARRAELAAIKERVSVARARSLALLASVRPAC
jgi:DNA-binding response OmpR family regulator